MATAFPALNNVATAKFAENYVEGIMVCGINWGGDPSGNMTPEEPSFFSDKDVNDYPYRNRLLRWFQLWGHSLETVRGRDGAFERSIIQTNWLSDQRRTMHGQDTYETCVSNRDNFFLHLRALRPRLVFFFAAPR